MQITIHNIKAVSENLSYLSGVQEWVRNITIETDTETISIRLYSEDEESLVPVGKEKKGFWDRMRSKL